MSGTGCKLHGYVNHFLSDSLETRHPYLEVPFEEFAPATCPPKPIFFRIFTNLRATLEKTELSDQKIQEALLILNDIASTQENKILMLNEELFELAAEATQRSELAAAEAISLLGSLCSIEKGRERLPKVTSHIKAVLAGNSDFLKRRMGWCLNRVASSIDGRDYLVKSGVCRTVVEGFCELVDKESLSEDGHHFLRLSLHVMREVLHDEESIFCFENTPVIKKIKKLLGICRLEPRSFPGHVDIVKSLCIDCTANLCVSADFRKQAVQVELIEELEPLLQLEDQAIQSLTARALAFISIDLGGKFNIIMLRNHAIIARAAKIFPSATDALFDNLSQLFFSLEENGSGFLAIIQHFLPYPKQMIDLFGLKCLVPLFELIRRLPPADKVVSDESARSVEEVFAPIFLLMDQEDGVENVLGYLLEKTSKFVKFALPYVLVARDEPFVESILNLILFVAEYEEFNRKIFVETMKAHKNLKNEHFNTTIETQIAKIPELQKLI